MRYRTLSRAGDPDVGQYNPMRGIQIAQLLRIMPYAQLRAQSQISCEECERQLNIDLDTVTAYLPHGSLLFSWSHIPFPGNGHAIGTKRAKGRESRRCGVRSNEEKKTLTGIVSRCI